MPLPKENTFSFPVINNKTSAIESRIAKTIFFVPEFFILDFRFLR
jgi:hypothetical protein